MDDEQNSGTGGAIVPSGIYDRHDPRWRSDRPRGNFRKGKAYPEPVVQAVIDERTLNPYATLQQIADKFDVSTETVRVWCGEAKASRERARVDVQALRNERAEELEVALRQMWALYSACKAASPPNLDGMVDAMNQIRQFTSIYARLMGLNAPIKIDVEATILTEAERELREMLDEAKAKAWATEQDTIKAASEDPDL